MSQWLVRVLAFVAVLLAASEARAFCGFFVSGADAKLYNNATQVVLLREGLRTVLSMQNNYQGPPEDFAMVVPVPVVLRRENVRTLDPEVFDHVDQLTAPRLVEYWEQDPCSDQSESSIGTFSNMPGGPPRPDVEQEKSDVRVLAQFVVGEYDVVVLGADDSMGLDRWLHEHGYKIPDGAEPYLRPYVATGSKFFVAKVDVRKVRFEKGMTRLSPLRFDYDAEQFSLPVRMGLVNSSGTQDLIVTILARSKRYEVANYPNAIIPTNLDVADSVRGDFGGFYAALFDATVAKNPRAVVTEYSWGAAWCDPCPTPALQPGDLETLGVDTLPPDTRTAKAVFADRMVPEIDRCLPKGEPVASGIYLPMSIDASGAVTPVARPGATITPLEACIEAAIRGTRFDPPGAPFKARAWVDEDGKKRFFVDHDLDISEYVATRLHARYTREQLGEDLIFREAPPVVGGRESSKELGPLAQGGAPSNDGQNWFQARYVIRHPWQGPLTCEHPEYGTWGGPPAESPAQPQRAKPARDLAFASRGSVALATVVSGEVPALGIRGTFVAGEHPGPPRSEETWVVRGLLLGVVLAWLLSWWASRKKPA